MLFTQQANSPAQVTAVVAGVLVTFVMLYLAMRFASFVQRALGEDGVELVTRVAGLLLSAIAVQMIADSVQDFVNTWS
jgi:multiple antibiotic resistance protein